MPSYIEPEEPPDEGSGGQIQKRSLITSALCTTKPGGGAWTKAALNALVDVHVAVDYKAGVNAARFGVSELWIEVFGEAGGVRCIEVSTSTPGLVSRIATMPSTG